MTKHSIRTNMKISRKQRITAIALIMTLTFSALMAMMPLANSHTPPWTLTQWCFVSVTNPVIGVNQDEVLVFWTNMAPASSGTYGDRWTFTVDITKPDGTKETVGPITSDPVGAGYIIYKPTQTGKYTVISKVAEHKMTGLPSFGGLPPTGAFVNDTFLAAQSDPTTFIVQQDPIKPWQETPLPTEFWTRPINGMNRDWYVLAGNWLAGAAQDVGPTNRFVYGTGPESAHIMWTTPMWAGGIMDARFGNIGYATEHYEGTSLLPPIILDGKLYYNVRSLPRMGWYCVDLYTGETEYFQNTTGPVTGVSQTSSGSIPYGALAFGQILEFECPNQHGGFPYLWSTSAPTSNTWMMYDAFTGNYMCSIGNVSASGTAVYGEDGSILRYNIVGTGANKRLTVWNTTQAIWWRGTEAMWQARDYSAFTSNAYWMWRPGLNVTYNGANGFSLNASIPDVQGTIRAVREDKYVIGGTAGKNNGTYVLQGNLWALNLKPGADGKINPTLLWNITFTPPLQTADDNSAAQQSAGTVTMGAVDPEDGVFLFKEKATRQWWGYSLETGKQIWGPTAPEPALNYYAAGAANIYQGKLLTVGFAGVLTAYDIKTGIVVWNYTAPQIGFESPYGNFPLSTPVAIADGKIYLTSGEHSHTQPLWRGGALRCINASNGAELWKVANFGGEENTVVTAMGDGYIVSLNQYDGQIYCFGKGTSATTVSIQNDVIEQGKNVLIKGTVTDQTNKAKGTPAIADSSMSAWMEYLYMQQPKPTTASGVPVHLTAIDPNGNLQDVGTATSNALGNYAIAWKPPVPGLYTVTASFAGSKSYYGSEAGTSFDVQIVTSTSPEVTKTPAQSMAPTPVQSTSPSPSAVVIPPMSASATSTYITIGAAVIIVLAAAAALILRRRK